MMLLGSRRFGQGPCLSSICYLHHTYLAFYANKNDTFVAVTCVALFLIHLNARLVWPLRSDATITGLRREHGGRQDHN